MLSFNRKKGFTLIELMVVVALTTIMASIFIMGRNQYNDRLILKNQAYAVAGLIRQAQGYSLGVRADAGQFGVSYGVSVSRDNPSQVIFFADRNRNGDYDLGESIETYTMPNGVQMVNLCGYAGSSQNCVSINTINITFNRPDPTAVIRFITNSGSQVAGRNPPAMIYVEASNGLGMVVSTDSTGQVSIQ
jgi:prepilin-type N-terminal cleavage/methylation domain-containing protein